MTVKPKTWHYGLMAELWANFLLDTPELPFYNQQIEGFGQPVLDLACGAGRLLLPLLSAGIDIDGCDISQDMLDMVRAKAEAERLSPNLYQGPMHALDLSRRYRLIYICGSFGLAGSRELDLETLRRCRQHLETGGALALNIQAEYAFPDAWLDWTEQQRNKFPQPWPEEGKTWRTSDGVEYISRFRVLELDPLEQTYQRQMRIEKWQSGELIAADEDTLRGNIYFKNELVLMLEKAGFKIITVYGDYSDEFANAGHKELVFVARKE